MIRPRHVARLISIYRVLRRHGLDDILHALEPKPPLSYALRLLPRSAANRDIALGERLRLALEDLGPIFVKFGQALSTRPDILPPDIARELTKLQDRVPPFPGKEATALIEEALGASVEETFAEFDREPLASASVAQVHAATLKDGQKVVVKILRPGIDKQISEDVDILHAAAAVVHKYWPASRRLRPRDVVREYDKTIHEELDLVREAANASQLRRNFPPENEILHIPAIFWDLCRPNAMVMERVSGIPVADIAQLEERGVNMEVLANRGVEIFFTQVFRHNFFHADMHPGNIFVDATDPAMPSYIAIDFGIVGTLTPSDQHYLAGNLLAFFKRDYRKVAQLHIESGWVPTGTRVDEFESAIRTVCEPIFNKPLKDISFGQFLVRLFSVARRFEMEVQPQLVLLQKTLLNIEGLGRQLYPDLDLWQTAKPFLEDWMIDQTSGKELFNKLKEHLPELSESVQLLPNLAFKALQQAADGKLQMQLDPAIAERERLRDRRMAATLHRSVAGGAALIGSALLFGLGAQPAWLAWTGVVFGLVFLWSARPHD
ncbi:MAG: ubiquinone biosynthesis regulatory protein kinase UbiB [Gammaproteobacteria bacterium]